MTLLFFNYSLQQFINLLFWFNLTNSNSYYFFINFPLSREKKNLNIIFLIQLYILQILQKLLLRCTYTTVQYRINFARKVLRTSHTWLLYSPILSPPMLICNSHGNASRQGTVFHKRADVFLVVLCAVR